MALFGGPTQPLSRLEELKRLLQRDPTSRQFLALAEEYRRHGKYRDAVITLERGLALHANSVAGYVALGKTYQQLDRLEDAIRAFTNALRIDRENLVAIRQLAEVYLAKGDKVEAIKKLKLYRGLKAGDRDVNDIIARLEQEMSAAVSERAVSRSGIRPAVEAPPGFPPPAGPVSSSSARRAALLRKLELQPDAPSAAAMPEAPLPAERAPEAAPEPAPEPQAPPRPAQPLELTYDGSSVGRSLERVRSAETPVAPPPDVFVETAPESPAPAPPSPELSPFTAPIAQIHEAAPAPEAPEPEPPVFEPPPDVDDDVPTVPFEFPVDLYRVASAAEPPQAPEGPAAEPAAPAAAVPEAPPPPRAPAVEPPLVTETLATLYETQGYAAAARETYETLARSQSDEHRARELREKAQRAPSARRAGHPRLSRLARRFPKRPEATANDIHAIIRALVESTDGIRAATLTDLEGLPVVTAGPAAREPGQEILVAELTSFLKGVGRTAGEVGAGALRTVTFRGERGTAVVARVNTDYSLVLHVDPEAILGEVRWEADRAARALSPAVR